MPHVFVFLILNKPNLKRIRVIAIRKQDPPGNATFEKHLENLLLYALRSIAADEGVPRREHDAASLLVDAAAIRKLPLLCRQIRYSDLKP
jgi:hypothetical protein